MRGVVELYGQLQVNGAAHAWGYGNADPDIGHRRASRFTEADFADYNAGVQLARDTYYDEKLGAI